MNATQQEEVAQLEVALRDIVAIPHLQVLTGRDVWQTFHRQLAALERRIRGPIISLYAIGALILAAAVLAGHVVFAIFFGVLLVVFLPASVAGILAWRSRRFAAFTLVTDRAHLVVAVKPARLGLTLEPTDHWVDRPYEERTRLFRKRVRRKGQATAFRRAVLAVLLEHVQEYNAVVKAHARNRKVREVYEKDLRSLNLNPAPLLKGAVRLYVTRELLQEAIRTAPRQ